MGWASGEGIRDTTEDEKGGLPGLVGAQWTCREVLR